MNNKRLSIIVLLQISRLRNQYTQSFGKSIYMFLCLQYTIFRYKPCNTYHNLIQTFTLISITSMHSKNVDVF